MDHFVRIKVCKNSNKLLSACDLGNMDSREKLHLDESKGNQAFGLETVLCFAVCTYLISFYLSSLTVA